MQNIENSSILITGGGSGIGKGTAKYLAKKGSKVTICGRREEKLVEVAQEIDYCIRRSFLAFFTRYEGAFERVV